MSGEDRCQGDKNTISRQEMEREKMWLVQRAFSEEVRPNLPPASCRKFKLLLDLHSSEDLQETGIIIFTLLRRNEASRS